MDPDLVKASRRKLEEIRQKKASSSATADAVLASVLGDQEYANSVRVPDASGMDLKKYDELEQEIASLRQALDSMTMERDAAIVAREDLNGQIRFLKRRLKDAEEEQYRAEEDAGALKKELEMLQQAERPLLHSSEFSMEADRLRSAQQEIDALRLELQGLEQRLRLEQQKSATLYERFEVVTAENCELQNSLAAGASEKNLLQESLAAAAKDKAELQKAVAAALASPSDLGRDLFDLSTATSASVNAGRSFITERSRYEEQLHHLQYILDKQEKGTQRLLNEVDAQSLEIERLFEENTSLYTSLTETSALATKWEDQLKESLEQNLQLRLKLNEMQLAQVHLKPQISTPTTTIEESGKLQEEETACQGGLSSNENLKLKTELSEARAKAEGLQIQVDQMSVDLTHALHVLGNITRAYQPVLLNIESRLAGLHQDFKRSIY